MPRDAKPSEDFVKEPTTPEEWQAALDALVALLEKDGSAARTYGLATVNVARCGEILRRATSLGYSPSLRRGTPTTAPPR